MESKIRTHSQTSSIIRQGIQYRQTKRPVGERLSSDFLELKEMFHGFVRDYQNTAGVNDVAKEEDSGCRMWRIRLTITLTIT